MENRASYVWDILSDPETDKEFIWIHDKDEGGKSVTNDMENILCDLLHEGIPIFDLPIMYKDSMKNWDGVKVTRLDRGFKFEFFPLQEKDIVKALNKLFSNESRI